MIEFKLQLLPLFSMEEYADWIWMVIRDYYLSEDAGRRMDLRISLKAGPNQLPDALADIYQWYIPKERKIFFHQAIGEVLEKISKRDEKEIATIVNDLTYLNSLIERIKENE